MCIVELPCKLYCTVSVALKLTDSGKIPVRGKQNDIIGIPDNLLHLLIPFVQNLTSTFFSFGVNFLPKLVLLK